MTSFVEIYGSAFSQFKADPYNNFMIEKLKKFEEQDKVLQVLKGIFKQAEAETLKKAKLQRKEIFITEEKVIIEEKYSQVKTKLEEIRERFYSVFVFIYYHKNIDRINSRCFEGIFNIFNEGTDLMQSISKDWENGDLIKLVDENLNKHANDKMQDIIELFFKEVSLLACWIAGTWREFFYQKNLQLNCASLTFGGKNDRLFSVFSFIPFYSYFDESFGRRNKEVEVNFGNFILKNPNIIHLTLFEAWNIDIIENMNKFISMPFSWLTLRAVWLEIQNILIDLFQEESNK